MGRSSNQLVVPNWLRRQKLEYSRSSFCQDYAKTSLDSAVHVKKINVKKVPLRSMPLIDMPFKRVAVDIVEPIATPSEAGH